MFSVKKGITLNEFSDETQTFLVKAGFTEGDDLSSVFENIVNKSFGSSEFISYGKVDLANVYDGKITKYDYKETKLSRLFLMKGDSLNCDDLSGNCISVDDSVHNKSFSFFNNKESVQGRCA